MLCKFIKDLSKGNCLQGKDYPYSHNKKLFDANDKYKGKGKGKGSSGAAQDRAGITR